MLGGSTQNLSRARLTRIYPGAAFLPAAKLARRVQGRPHSNLPPLARESREDPFQPVPARCKPAKPLALTPRPSSRAPNRLQRKPGILLPGFYPRPGLPLPGPTRVRPLSSPSGRSPPGSASPPRRSTSSARPALYPTSGSPTPSGSRPGPGRLPGDSRTIWPAPLKSFCRCWRANALPNEGAADEKVDGRRGATRS